MKRDLILDSFRGFFLLLMTFDHLTAINVRDFTYKTYGLFTAADGFFFLSGFVYGMVYFKYIDNIDYIKRKSLKRSFTIYKYHIALCLIFITESLLMNALYGHSTIDSVASIIHSPLNFGAKYLFLLHAPGWFGVLPLYVIFLLIAPFFLQQIGKEKHIKVLAISLSVYLVAQFPQFTRLLTSFEQSFNTTLSGFNIFEWQFIFFLGMYFGTRRRLYGKAVPKKNVYFVIAVFAVIAGIYFRHFYQPNTDFTKFIFNSSGLSIVRIFNFLAAVYLASHLTRKIKIRRRGYLSFIGQHSLEVYAFHLLVVVHFNNVYDKIDSIVIRYVLIFMVVISLLAPAFISEYLKSKRLTKHNA